MPATGGQQLATDNMVTFPHCKINLGLQVISRRPDGYHDIATCFYPLPWTDVLEILPSDDLTFTQTGISIPGEKQDNICLKAYHILREDFSLPPVQIHLHKIIPTGAGLGGGSSDAAFTLRSLNTSFDLKLSKEELLGYALKLGSDCPFFIQEKPMMGRGRGELLEPVAIDMQRHFLVVLIPDVHVATAEAYKGVTPKIPGDDLDHVVTKPLTTWKAALKNDFEASVFEKYPSIRVVKERLYSLGAVYASMSGSGSSVFGIFDRPVAVEKEFKDLSGWSGWL